METEDRERTTYTQEQIEVDFFRPADAKGIVELFRAVYGEGYPIKLFYDEKALTEANSEGQYYSIVARTTSGKVLGVVHLYRSAPYESLYEAGAGLVLKECRNLGLNKRLLHFVFDQWASTQDNIEQTFGEPVCNHVHMQRVVSQMAHVETALEVALMPAEAYDKERSAKGRVAALLAFRCYKPKPHKVFLPPAYERESRWIYAALDDSRDLATGKKSLPENLSSKGKMTVFDFARMARIAIYESGHDLAQFISDLENQALAQNVLVIQVWLKLSTPWSGSAVDILRNKGYFLGGVLPRWFDEDGFLMQKLICEPYFEEIQLHSDRAKEICAMVKQDWTRVKSTGH
jgi:hypothetical protein